MSDNEMAEKIRTLRKLNKLTLQEVGDACGVGRSTVRKWEVGMIQNMGRDKIASLAKVLNTNPAYLMGWKNDPTYAEPVIVVNPDKTDDFSETKMALVDLISELSEKEAASFLAFLESTVDKEK